MALSNAQYDEAEARRFQALLKLLDGERIHRNSVRAMIRDGILEDDGATITESGHAFMQAYGAAHPDEVPATYTIDDSADSGAGIETVGDRALIVVPQHLHIGEPPACAPEVEHILALKAQINSTHLQNEMLSRELETARADIHRLRAALRALIQRQVDDVIRDALTSLQDTEVWEG